jgi:streptogramin lyase
VDILDPISFKVQPFENYFADSIDLKAIDIYKIQTDTSGNMYLVTKNNDIYSYKQEGFSKILHLNDSRGIYVVMLNNQFLTVQLTNSDSISMWDLNGKRIGDFPFPVKVASKGFQEQNWRIMGNWDEGHQLAILEDYYYSNNLKGYAWLGKEGFSDFQLVPFRTKPFRFTYYDKKDHILWSFNDEFFITLDPKTGKEETIFRDDRITPRTLFKDRLNNVWIGIDDGIYIISRRPHYFKTYLTGQTPSFSCRGFTEYNNRIYIFSQKIDNYIFNPATESFSDWTATRDLLGLAAITSKDGMIYFTKEHSFCYKYNPLTDKVTTYQFPIQKYFGQWSIAETDDEQILYGTIEGLWMKSAKDDKDPVRFNKLNGFNELNSSSIYNIQIYPEGIWLSTDNGLFLVDLKEGVKEYITEENSGLPNNSLLYLHKDADGIYWIASRGGGLIRWDRSKNVFKSYTVNEGLSIMSSMPFMRMILVTSGCLLILA